MYRLPSNIFVIENEFLQEIINLKKVCEKNKFLFFIKDLKNNLLKGNALISPITNFCENIKNILDNYLKIFNI